jgi:hypothetical protein
VPWLPTQLPKAVHDHDHDHVHVNVHVYVEAIVDVDVDGFISLFLAKAAASCYVVS